MWYAVIFAIVGGVLLALSHWVAGCVLVALALIGSAANYFDNDDSSGLYGN